MRQADLSLAFPMRLRRADLGSLTLTAPPLTKLEMDQHFSRLNCPSPGCQAGAAGRTRDQAEPSQTQEAGGPFL